MCGGDRVCVADVKWAWARATSKHPVVPRSAPTRESVTQRNSSMLGSGPHQPYSSVTQIVSEMIAYAKCTLNFMGMWISWQN